MRESRTLMMILMALVSFTLSANEKCESQLMRVEGANLVESEQKILSERHELFDLLQTNKELNLAYNNPFIVMNAAQRIYSIIKESGFSEMNLYGYGKVRVPNLFHQATALTDGKMIMGHEAGTASFVAQLRRSVTGDANVITFTGPHGTGKSEILTVLGAALKNYTSVNERGSFFSYEWKDLDKIPGLFDILNTVKGKISGTLPVETRESPFILLPEVYQEEVLKMVSPVVRERIDTDPMPFTIMTPKTEYVRNAIIEHYATEENADRSSENIVRWLNNHVVIKRVVLGDKNNLVKLDAQGRDWRPGELFIEENPVMSMTLRKHHPFSWDLGVLARASGSVAFIDELLRNEETLRDKFLTLFQERVLSHGGSHVIPVDMLILTATNNANVKTVLADETGHAQVDRLMPIPFLYSTEPQLVAPTLGLMKAGSLYAQKLGEDESEIFRVFPEKKSKKRSFINDLWVRSQVGEQVVTPHGRYRLYFGDGESRVVVAPHAIDYISYVVAASRMKTDQAEAAARNLQSDVVHNRTNIFRDEVERILFFSGMKKEVNTALHVELAKVTALLGEGHEGIATREASRWLNKAIEVAERPGRGNTLDYEAIKEGFELMAKDSDTISQETRVKVLMLLDKIGDKLILQKIAQDINSAVIDDASTYERVYMEFIQSEVTLSNNPEAKTFHDVNKEEHPINTDLLKKVHQAFSEITGRMWNRDIIGRFANEMLLNPEKKDLKHPDIMTAVQKVIANDVTSNTHLLENFYQLSKGGEVSSKEVMTKWGQFHKTMEEKYGYNTYGLRAALQMIKQQAVNKTTQGQ